MDVVLWLGLGLVGGLAAMLVVFRTFPTEIAQWIGALAAGLLGGWLGGWLFRLLGLEQANWLGSLIVAFIGASVIMLAVRKATPGAGADRSGGRNSG